MRYQLVPFVTHRAVAIASGPFPLISLSALLLLLSAGCVRAEVIITGELPPYSSAGLANNGELASKVLTVLRAVGYPDLQVSYQPWPRGLKNIELGNAIAAFPFTWTNERGNRLLFSTPVAFDIQSWYTTPDKKILESLSWHQKTACVPKGWFSEVIARVITEQGLIVRTTNRLRQCVELLKKGKVDLVPINDTSKKSLSKEDYTALYRLSLFRQNVTFYLVTPRNEVGEILIRDFNHKWSELAY
ncbi:transporter substrate-binding domain-containing protein [Aeromonas salmonicida]|uniref:transporter substrate-binding domain-containing protein n=1 Tax=Aeromonas salmonicida TaxID=645 RepID=UPI002331580C|nr:transporter substrate-binding domain-containing protein [Aeromonas salmonicida]WCH23585.1 transporter substrate-binding domain-containing protein [Aeromonas salmonicida]